MRILTLTAMMISIVCTGLYGQSEQQAKNRVVVMGMVHSHHKTEPLYSIDKVKQIIRNVAPDVVLTEIPPDRIADAMAQFESTGKITESRVSRFPEYVDALFPLTREIDFQIVPCAAWTKDMADRRKKKMHELKQSHADQYAQMEQAQQTANEEIGKLGSIHDPTVIHTDEYDELVRIGLKPYDQHFNELIGDGGWTNINVAHYALIEKSLDEYRGQGKTILITFGSWHKHYIKDQLRKRTDIQLVSLQDYLPQTENTLKKWPRFRLSPDQSGSWGKTEIQQPVVDWKFDTGEIIESSPAVVGNKVYIGGHSKSLFAIDRKSGQLLWQFETAGWVRASPSVVDGTVYFGSDDNKFYALDATTGEKQWDFALGEGGEQSSPAIDRGVVYFGAFDHHVYALDAKTGVAKWKFDAEASMLSSPALSESAVFIATYAGKVFAIDRNNGKKIWEFSQNGKPIFSSPVYHDGKLYFTSYDHHVYAINAADSKLIWKLKTGDEIFSSPAIVDEVLYVGSNDNHLYAIKVDDRVVAWKTNLNGAVFASPTITKNSIYVGSSDGCFYCLNRDNGKQRWKHLVKDGARVWSSAAAVDGHLYFGSHDGEVIALRNR